MLRLCCFRRLTWIFASVVLASWFFLLTSGVAAGERPRQEGAGVDVLILVDASDSMNTLDEKRMADKVTRSVVEDLLTLLPGDTTSRLGIVCFTIGIEPLPELIPLSEVWLEDLQFKCERKKGTGTKFPELLQEALSVFKTQPRPENRKIIILITDGHPSACPGSLVKEDENNRDYLRSRVVPQIDMLEKSEETPALFVIGVGNVQYKDFWKQHSDFTLVDKTDDLVKLDKVLRQLVPVAPTPSPTPTQTSTPVATPSPTPTPTSTPVPTPCPTPTPTLTRVPTATPSPSPTWTPSSSATPGPTLTPSATSTVVLRITPTPTPTATPMPPWVGLLPPSVSAAIERFWWVVIVIVSISVTCMASRQLGLLNRLRVAVQVVLTLLDSFAGSIYRSRRIIDLRIAQLKYSPLAIWTILERIHQADEQQFMGCYAPAMADLFRNARGKFQQQQELLNKLADDYGRTEGHFRRGASEAIRRIVQFAQLHRQKGEILGDLEILTHLRRNGVNVKEVLSETQTGGG